MLVIQFNVSKEKEKKKKRKKKEKKQKKFDFPFRINFNHTNRFTRGLLVDQNRVYPPFALMTAASLFGMDEKRRLQ